MKPIDVGSVAHGGRLLYCAFAGRGVSVGRDNGMGNKCLWGVLFYVTGQNHTESRKRFGIINRSSRGAQGYHADSVKDLQFGVYLQGDEAFSCNSTPS